MNRAARQRESFRRLTEALATPLPATDMHQLVVEEASRLTDAASAALCLLDESRTMLDFVAVAGGSAAEILGLRIRLADSLSEAVVASGEPVLIDNRTPQPSLGDPLIFADNSVGPRSAAVVPIYQDKRLIGTLSALNKNSEDTSFGEEDLDILALLAEFAALGRRVDHTARTAREQSRELAVLYDAAQTVAGSLNVQEVLESVLTAICNHLEHYAAVLFLLNDERTHLFIASQRGLAEDESDIQLSVDAGIGARVLHSGQPRLIPDTDLELDYQDISQRARVLSAMIAPIRSREETHGLILVTSLERHAYRADDLKLLAAVAMQAGIAMENAWLYEDARRRAEESAALYDLSQHVNATLHLDRVLNFVADSVLNLLTVDKFALYLYDRSEERLVVRLSRNVDEPALAAIRPRVGEGIAGWVYEWQTPQAVADVAADARNKTAPIDQAGVASTLCVPMQVGDEVIGVIHAMNSKRRLFTVSEMELLYTIANQAAVAAWNAVLYQEARAKSHEMRRYFRRVAHAIGTALDERDLPQLLAELALEIMRADRCALYRLDGDVLRLQVTSSFRLSNPPDAEIPLGSGLAGWVARRGQSLVIPNIAEDPRSRAYTWLHRDHVTSYLAVPVKSGRRTVGVVEVYSVEPRHFNKEEVQLLSMFARRSKVAEKMGVPA